MTSPTQRTLAELRKIGWTCAIVERWNQYAKIRQDLFGFIDIVAIRPGEILAVQACAGASHAARRDKIIAEPKSAQWLAAGGLIEIWSWRKAGERGKRKLWTPRVERIETFDHSQLASE